MQVWQALTDGTPVVVTSHQDLDGDGIGASLALWHALRGVGVRCTQIFESPVPAVFEFLAGLDQRAGSVDELPDRFQLAVVDCSSLRRIGSLAAQMDRVDRIVNIDHHLTNDLFGEVNYVERDVSSCGELVYRTMVAGGVPITKEIADCLFTAILTDTGRFCHANSTMQCFEICAELVRAGAHPYELADKIYYSPPPAVIRLQTLAMGTLELEDDGRVATMQISEEMFRRTGTRAADTQGFADIPVFVKGVEVSVLLKELPDASGSNGIKVSLRSRPGDDGVDVCSVAKAFGGGGHRHAAGFELAGTLAEARLAVVDRLRRGPRS
jgi:phosphoesterase RecJ-like protein